MPQPNIIFLHSHNTGRYVQPYGHAVPTPHLQRLAEQGVLFRQAFAAAPTCSPSRAAFLSGMHPHTAGMFGLGHRGFRMLDYGRHLVATLRRAGYLTALAGVEHTAPDTALVGYDLNLSQHDTNYPGPRRRPAAPAAVEFLRSAPQQPFFLSVGLNETHRPFPEPEPELHPAEDPRYCIPPRPLPDNPTTRHEMASFKAAARRMDDSWGAILAALDETGLADHTLVCCFTDHGLQFPLNMCHLTDHGLGVYLVVRGPGGFTGGGVIDAMVSLIDLCPTVCDVAGLAPEPWYEGHSLAPLVRGEVAALHEELFGEVNYHAALEPMRSLRTNRWKYIRRFDDRRALVLPNTDDTASKAWLLEHDWLNQPRHQELLFDLWYDPDEVHNLAADPAHTATLDALRARLERWMTDTADPLLHGEVPAPPDATTNDPDGLSPRDEPRRVHG